MHAASDVDGQAMGLLRDGLVDGLVERGEVTSPGLAHALRRVPRHAFLAGHVFWPPGGHEAVPQAESLFYRDSPLVVKTSPAGGIVASCPSPSLVAHLVELLRVPAWAGVLEIGAGTGYAAAVLAELATRVETVELDPRLAAAARDALARNGYGGVTVHCADATRCTFPQTYDRILVSVAVLGIPESWIAALRPGGLLVCTQPAAWRGVTLVVSKDDDGAAAGRFVDNKGRLCPAIVDGDGPELLFAAGPAEPVQARLEFFTPTDRIEPNVPLGLGLLAKWCLPGLTLYPAPDQVEIVDAGTGAGASVGPDGAVRASAGGAELVARLAALTSLWKRLGRPGPQDYRVDWTPGSAVLSAGDAPARLPLGAMPPAAG